jgi:hypothetical protein
MRWFDLSILFDPSSSHDFRRRMAARVAFAFDPFQK